MDDDHGSDEVVAECELKAGELNIPPYRPSKSEPMWVKVTFNGK